MKKGGIKRPPPPLTRPLTKEEMESIRRISKSARQLIDEIMARENHLRNSESNTMSKLIGTASTMEGVERVAKDFFSGSQITLVEKEDGTWKVHTRKGETAVLVRKKGQKFRLELP